MASPMQQFEIKKLVPIEVGGIDLSFTQSSLTMLIGVAIATLFLMMSVKQRALVPGRLQNVGEVMYEFIAGMVRDTLGTEGRKYFPFVFTIFLIVLMGNLLGMVPYSFTYTSHIIVTGALALMVFLFATFLGFVKHGFHFLSFFVPKGVPFFILPLIVVIEVISYLSRPLSMSLRLFINMMAGHTLLKVIAGFCVSLGALYGVLPMLVNTALIALELMIAFVQAYVFAILTCMYLKDSIELHH